MARKPLTDLSAWPSLTLEGNLLAPALVAMIAQPKDDADTRQGYGLRKGLTIREEISTSFRVGQSHFDAFAALRDPSVEETQRFVRDFLHETFGFTDLAPGPGAVAFVAGGRVPVVVAPPADESLDRRSRALSSDRPRSPAFALQDHLNEHDETLWGLVTNGTLLRLMRDNASLTRPAFIEADLRQIFGNEDAASFSVLWLLIHRSRFGTSAAPATDCALEHWREAGSREGEVARDRLAGQVREALKTLGSGFLEANPDLAARLTSGELDLTEWFNELLRLVYRLIFLLVAEDRDLLHPEGARRDARQLYAEGYSLTALRVQSARAAAWDRYFDRYEGLQIVFRALAEGEERLALPSLGGLFAADALPHLAGARLRNRAFLKALHRLSWLNDRAGLVPVNWRAMETEELGSVYESLLELQPQLAEDGRSLLFASEAAEQKGNQRKTTGSYYTPDSLVQALLDTALDPVLDQVIERERRTANGEWQKPDGAWLSAEEAWRHDAFLRHARRVLAHSAERETGSPGRADEAGTDPVLSRERVDRAHAKVPAEAVKAAWDATPFPLRHSLFAADALLHLTVIDPACGSGHFLLAAARRIATRLARLRAEGTPSLADFRQALRDVARSCLYGVDRNPMAVELTKVALWIETVNPGRPLGFFDAQIRCGDALLGVFDLRVLEDGVPDAAYKPLTGDDKATANEYRKANRDARSGQGHLGLFGGGGHVPEGKPLALDFSGLRDLPEDTREQIEAKARRFAELRHGETFRRARTAADLYVAAFLQPKIGGRAATPAARTVPTTEEVWLALNRGEVRPALAEAPAAARRARALHWPLEFPDVMARGGFDVVLGNPPWERIKLQEQEFFAARSPDIAGAANKAARDRQIRALAEAPAGSPERALHEAFTTARREAEATSEFVRLAAEDGGRFALAGRGDVNTYALFAELFANLSRQRAGVIVPTGIATDATTAPFFAHLVEERRLARLIDFENSAPIFVGVHRSFKFSLLTLGREEPTARFAFFLTEPGQLADPERSFPLTPEQIAAINPNTRTAPVFRSRADAELTAKIYAQAPVLIDEGKGAEGNPWGVTFMAMFHMSNDSHLFRTAAQLGEAGFTRAGTDWEKGPERFVPLYEAKMIHQFDHRWAGYAENGSDSADCGEREKSDPGFEPSPRYWVPAREVDERLSVRGWTRGWLLGWRDIARATDERTVIATVFPRVGVGNQLPIMLFDPLQSPQKLAVLSANLSAIALDYAARFKVGGTHLNFFVYQQLPILPPDFYTEGRLAFVVPRVLELTYTSWSLAPFARDLGYDGPPFGWDEERRARLRAELDAFYARAYGLTRDELRYILDPADVRGPDYPSETFRVLKEKELRRHGEYRTRRLVLAAWDEMEEE